MNRYYVNKNAQSTGEHEVHKSGCSRMPDASNRIDLGLCANCTEAIEKAKQHYSNVDGCYYCTNCHTR